ncbi:SsrA-binding protein SmpB [Candidatus Kuenenbacteria bacterium]|nr:SsrA-binding protein SmpB [Candidatus Kuenenbacteria bacterium]
MQAISNKQAFFSYEILEKFQAGLVLKGHEVKSIKNGQISLKGAYITIQNNPKPELYLVKAHVAKYTKTGDIPDYDPERPRKLLITKNELKALIGKLEQKGLTIVPLKVYTERTLVKLQFGLARGKKLFEKKEQKKNKDVAKEIRRTLKYQRE